MKTVSLKTEDFGAAFAFYQAVWAEFPALSPDSFRDALSRNLARGSVRGVWCGEKLAGLLVYSPRQSGELAMVNDVSTDIRNTGNGTRRKRFYG